jgi:hypothetical protein
MFSAWFHYTVPLDAVARLHVRYALMKHSFPPLSQGAIKSSISRTNLGIGLFSRGLGAFSRQVPGGRIQYLEDRLVRL